MFSTLKKTFYFPIASYFKFFASIRLKGWKPRIIVITGSSGKTTLLHLLESQIGEKAVYSHLANSGFGVPFHILGLKRETLTFLEWPKFFLLAPFKAFETPPQQKIYIVEADCGMVGEGKFLAELLKPEVTIWLSSTKTHSAYFPEPVESNIAHEFGYFPEFTSKVIITNGDSKIIQSELSRSKAKQIIVTKNKYLEKYQIDTNDTQFIIDGTTYKIKFILPEETFYQIVAMEKVLEYLNLPIDSSFSKLTVPAGRSSIFKGIKNTTILDSSYNADLQSMRVMLNMFSQYPAKKKWVVLGDLVEQGTLEESEHKGLVPILKSIKPDKIILVGPRLAKYTHPEIESESFIYPNDSLKYILANIQGGETIFFKGARFLEGIIEHLLENKSDVAKLCRREKVWQERRKKWGL